MAINYFSVALALAVVVAAQDPKPPSLQTLHIAGSIGPVASCPNPCDITFKSSNAADGVTLKPDAEGNYEADLPLGTYTMTLPMAVQRNARPLFRVTTPGTLQQTVRLRDQGYHDAIPIPAKDGTRFEIRVFAPDYWWGLTGARGYNWDSRSGEMALVEYNVYTMWAEHIVYHKREHQIEGRGRVVFRDGSGNEQNFKQAIFKIEDGTLTLLKSKN
jgi:hypothetical protein